jgi:lipase maturation factor 1
MVQYKPGPLDRSPLWNIPHQPRLDFQMWFAALGTAPKEPWLKAFLHQLLQGSPHVTALLECNSFPKTPPKYVRAMLYDYQFTSSREKAASGRWWGLRPAGMYYPPTAHAMSKPIGSSGDSLLDSIRRPR